MTGRPGQLRSGRGPLVALAAVTLALPVYAAAQEGCEFGDEGNDRFRRVGPISYVSNPHFVCADGVQIWADSAVAYSELGMSHLIGSVRYLDRTRELQADTARYFSEQGRLQANGRVSIRDDADGSQVRNGDLIYLRVTDFRDTEEMTVTTGRDGLRPFARLTPSRPDSAPASGEPPDPYTVVADRIFTMGDAYFAASGTVEIRQDSLLAYADSAEYDEGADALVLDGAASMTSRGTELVGRTISIGSPGGATSEVRAVHEAVLVGEGIQLTSPQILVFLTEGRLQRLVAMRIPLEEGVEPDSVDRIRPVAVLEEAEMTGDSLDIIAPDEAVHRVVAVGGARSVSIAQDSLTTDALPEVASSDWLEGDTVTVLFAAAPDSLRVMASPPAAAVADTAMADVDAVPEAPADTAMADVDAVPEAADDPPGEPETSPEPQMPASDEPAPPADSAAVAEEALGEGEGMGDAPPAPNEVERIVAAGAARALYRLAPSDTASRAGVDPPALHYVVGSRITIRMVRGDVDGIQVTGQTRGVHLEPLPRRPVADSAAVAPPDSAAAPTDTTTAPTDTMAAPTDTTRLNAGRGGDGHRTEPGAIAPPTRGARRSISRWEEPWRRD